MKPVVINPVGSKGTVELTITGVATGAATLVSAIDGVTSTYITLPAESAADAATNWGAQLVTDMGTSYVVSVLGVVITISTASGAFIKTDFVMTTDGTQSVAASGWEINSSVMSVQQTAATGLPLSSTSGFAVGSGSPDAPVTLFIRAKLLNISGGVKDARFRLWRWLPDQGWGADQVVGLDTVSAGAAVVVAEEYLTVSVVASRVAIELVDDGAGGNLANCFFSAWVSY
jgi:hypothetical protein